MEPSKPTPDASESEVFGIFLRRYKERLSSPDIRGHDGDDDDAQRVAAGAEHVRPGVLEHKAEALVSGGRRSKLRYSTELAIVKPYFFGEAGARQHDMMIAVTKITSLLPNPERYFDF